MRERIKNQSVAEGREGTLDQLEEVYDAGKHISLEGRPEGKHLGLFTNSTWNIPGVSFRTSERHLFCAYRVFISLSEGHLVPFESTWWRQGKIEAMRWFSCRRSTMSLSTGGANREEGWPAAEEILLWSEICCSCSEGLGLVCAADQLLVRETFGHFLSLCFHGIWYQ